MERKIIVIFNIYDKTLSIKAIEKLEDNSFLVLYKDNHIPISNSLPLCQLAIKNIESIINGKLEHIILSFEDANDYYFYTKEQNVQINSVFSPENAYDIEKSLEYDPENGHLTMQRILSLKYLNTQGEWVNANTYTDFVNKYVYDLKIKQRLSFIKKEKYEFIKNIINNMGLKILKTVNSTEALSVYMSKITDKKERNVFINIKPNCVAISYLHNNNFINFKKLSYGYNDLNQFISKKFNIDIELSTYLISNINSLKTIQKSPLVFRKNIDYQQLKNTIDSFYKNISSEAEMLLKMNNVFDSKHINISLLENNFIRQTIQNNNNKDKVTNFKIINSQKLSSNINLETTAIIDYLNIDISDHDVTDTLIINTQEMTQVKFKKNMWQWVKNAFNTLGVKNGR
ncbi:hypothetical protein [Mycoplasma phocoenae]|uniref:Uncharacterized protein n=1 Tax=Mycoplasma phocoenae TaxID=754517 RepID=A0A858U8R0_9MOLU|nr:hypothetical protein [Mycoplasma phocoenae]QJG67118.1 hypothetical protein HGG69_02235 [Mycoplasma phocoenae]